MVRFRVENAGTRLRVGWIAPGRFKEAVIRRKHIHQISTPTLNQEAIANFMENDRYENHLRKLRHELHGNSLRFIQAIMDYFPDDTRCITPQGGFMLWVELDKRIDTADLYRRGYAGENQYRPRPHVHVAGSVQELYAPELRATLEPPYRRTPEDVGRHHPEITVTGQCIPSRLRRSP